MKLLRNITIVDKAAWDKLHASKWNALRPVPVLLLYNELDGSVIIEKCDWNKGLVGAKLDKTNIETIRQLFTDRNLVIDI